MTYIRSQRQAQANRANCLRSTGPRTAAGKAAVAQNAITHGLHTEIVVTPNEHAAELVAMRNERMREYQPQTAGQWAVVEELVMAAWRVRRARTAEQAVFNYYAKVRRDNPNPSQRRAAMGVIVGLLDNISAKIQNYERKYKAAVAHAEDMKNARAKARTAAQEAICPEQSHFVSFASLPASRDGQGGNRTVGAAG